MRNWILSILLLAACYQAGAQIVNTERKRGKGESGWSGDANVGLALIKNTRQIIQLTGRMNVHYKKKQHSFMSLSDFAWMRVDKESLLNKGFQHLRYNYELKPYLIPEVFVQGQFNQIQKIDKRMLAGAGPRFRIFETDTSRLYFGSLYMYEYEEISDTSLVNRDHRMSAYVSFGYAFSKLFSVDLINYYQPKIIDPADFRLSGEVSLKFNLTDQLTFAARFNLVHDTRPPEGLENTYYTLTNAFGFKF